MDEPLSISRMIHNFNIAKISRIANGVAHEIAKFSFSTRSDGILFNSVPPCVVYAVTNDCKNFSLAAECPGHLACHVIQNVHVTSHSVHSP